MDSDSIDELLYSILEQEEQEKTSVVFEYRTRRVFEYSSTSSSSTTWRVFEYRTWRVFEYRTRRVFEYSSTTLRVFAGIPVGVGGPATGTGDIPTSVPPVNQYETGIFPKFILCLYFEMKTIYS